MSGVLTISVEVELGWGVHDIAADEHLSADGRTERRYLRKLLDRADACDVPISFDIVGHLLHESCSGAHDGPYPTGWFDADPGTDRETDPLYYAPDVARQILAADVDHELCTHTYSHLLCHEASAELVAHELRHVQDLHREIDGPVTSFVPPRHYRPDNSVLREHGIRTARYARDSSSPTSAHRFKHLSVGPHPEWEPRVVDGVLETYCTNYPSLTASSLPAGQRETHPAFRPLPVSVRKRTHRYYLRRATERAISSGTPLHLWCHLFDISNEHQWAVLSDFLRYLAGVPEDRLQVVTMDGLADLFEVQSSQRAERPQESR